MDKIAIDTDIPPPVTKSRKDPLYPWLSMKPGDSFVVEGRTLAAAARGSFRRYQKMGLIPPEFSVAQRTEDRYPTDLSVRLWLVEREK
jgi:hypothetical protein